MSAQPTQLRQPGFTVYICGVITSLLVLWGVSVMQDHGENPMGWYANGIIPAGAFLVGLASGVGYALASYFFNVKLSKAFLGFMLLTGVLDYATMHLLTYADLIERAHVDPAQYSFITWFREATEGMTFKSSSSSSPGSALGMWGYAFRLLELVGFGAGVVSPCAIVLGKAYCGSCQKYLKPHLTRVVSSPKTTTDWKNVPRKQRPEFLQGAINELLTEVQPTLDSVQTLDLDGVRNLLGSIGEAKPVKKTAACVSIAVRKCPHCDSHHITATLSNVTNDGKHKATTLSTFDKPAEPPVQAAA